MESSQPKDNRQPNSRMCFICGLENPFGLKVRFLQPEPGVVEAVWTAPAEYQGYPGVLHGGIAAALLDEAGGRTIIEGDPPRFMVTMKLEIKYRKPVPTGQPLRIEARLLADRGRTARAESRIILPDGSVAVEADVLLGLAPADFMDMNVLDRIGWRVYD